MNEHVSRLIVRSGDPRPGTRFGRLRVLGAAFWIQNDRKWREACVVCQCSCGTIDVIPCSELSAGVTRSCGCVRGSLARARG